MHPLIRIDYILYTFHKVSLALKESKIVIFYRTLSGVLNIIMYRANEGTLFLVHCTLLASFRQFVYTILQTDRKIGRQHMALERFSSTEVTYCFV